MSIRDVFHMAWGPALHIGYFDVVECDVPVAVVAADARMAGNLDPEHGSLALEIGCGFAKASERLADRFQCASVATDLEEWRLRQAAENMRPGLPVFFARADHAALPFAQASFDVLWAAETLCYSGNLLQSISEMARVLRPGGSIAVLDTFAPLPLDPRPVLALNSARHLWSRDRWLKAFATFGFDVIRWEDWTPHARKTYRLLAQSFEGELSGHAGARMAFENMRRRLLCIDEEAFGQFFALLRKH